MCPRLSLRPSIIKPRYDLTPCPPSWVQSNRSQQRAEGVARRYLERVQSLIGAPIDMVSTGPDRDHTILLRHPYKA